MNRKALGSISVGGAIALLLGLLAIPMVVIGGTSMLFAGSGSLGCTPGASQSVAQPGVSTAAANSIPSNYLMWYRKVGQQYGISWTVLAGIGKVESDHGRTTLPGVHSGANAFGAAGPMQMGIERRRRRRVGHVRHRRGRQAPGLGVRPGGRDRRRGEVPHRARRAKRRVGGDLRVQPRELVRPGGPVVGVDVRDRRVHGQRRQPGRLRLRVVDLVHRDGTARRPRHADRRGGDRDQLRRAAARQAVPVGRHRPGRVRLLGSGDDGVPGRGDLHRADLRGRSGQRCRTSPPTRWSPATWCSSPARTARPRRPATSAW